MAKPDPKKRPKLKKGDKVLQIELQTRPNEGRHMHKAKIDEVDEVKNKKVKLKKDKTIDFEENGETGINIRLLKLTPKIIKRLTESSYLCGDINNIASIGIDDSILDRWDRENESEQ